jgi:hypothetical protein
MLGAAAGMALLLDQMTKIAARAALPPAEGAAAGDVGRLLELTWNVLQGRAPQRNRRQSRRP